jgi:hypothetical protein
MNFPPSPNLPRETITPGRSTEHMVAVRRLWPGMLLVIIFALVMWRLPLFTGRSVIHGDMIGFGLPLFDLAGRAFWNNGSTLWASGVYGGHPLFAEGQGSFASPLNALVTLVITPIAGPIFAMNFFQFLCMLLTAIGMIGLCRRLKFTVVACTFSALAVTFSPIWISWVFHNPVLAGTFLWVPWCLWSVESWLQQSDLRSSVFLGSTCAAMVLAGYTPELHATLIYMVIRVIAGAIDGTERHEWMRRWRPRMMTVVAAVIIFLCLSAIQWIPLLELVGQSHRNAGAGLVLQHDGMMFLRGIFYEHPRQYDVVSIGSPLICMMALLAVFGARSPRMIGHLLAAFFLIQLGFGNGSALFRFIYDHNFLPGLHYFRSVFHYTATGVIGAAIVTGSVIDSLPRWFSTQTQIRRRIVLLCVAAIWACGAMALYASNASLPELTIAVVAFIVIALLALDTIKFDRFVPMVLLILLAAECSLRLFPFQMVRSDNLQVPASVSAIQSTKNWSDFKVLDTTFSIAYAFRDPLAPNMPAEMKTMLSSMSGLTSTMWGLHSMDGALALPVARHNMLTQPILDEVHGDSALPPGLRLIDTLGIRYIATYGPAKDGLALRPFWHNGDAPWILENTAALPRFQVYGDHVTVNSPDAALAYMQAWTKRTLVIENPNGAHHQTEPQDASPTNTVTLPDSAPLQFEVSKATDTDYHLHLQATKPCWLFLADANYPGWKAYIDGKPVPVFSAQVLGKAVAVPAGQHDLVISFEPLSFRWGARISLATLILTVISLMLIQWRNRKNLRA